MKRSSGGAGYEIVDHTADWALRVYGANITELLVQAALGMTSLIAPDPLQVPTNIERHLELDAFDSETLLVDWLSELAYWAEDELLVFKEFELSDVTEIYLKAKVRGGRVPALAKHIKAVTYHELEIIKTERGLTATVVFDV